MKDDKYSEHKKYSDIYIYVWVTFNKLNDWKLIQLYLKKNIIKFL